MKLTAGQNLVSLVDSTSVIVVRAPAGEVRITCGGREMVPQGSTAVSVLSPVPGQGGAQLGKRYADEELGLELLCVKGGSEQLAADGAPLAPKTAKPLPASD
ncbi:hypothetical protein HFP15_01705 [Amycolatopsis sp. K13G38]|uniref:Uncharacterized protein n=1 Tax=Amycolatopsis acididurans TaxID=2724524 RepID=A0ABX1IVU2_9PSEU|nr:hypothetical protein [Amycolatopsis acididurans]NKQ51591.1 hypothetical protein [Amycolatopsis acididurans]